MKTGSRVEARDVEGFSNNGKRDEKEMGGGGEESPAVDQRLQQQLQPDCLVLVFGDF